VVWRGPQANGRMPHETAINKPGVSRHRACFRFPPSATQIAGDLRTKGSSEKSPALLRDRLAG